MKNYVLSLTTATERRNHIKAEFAKQSIEFEFFDAITPEQVNALADQYHIPIKDARLSAGEQACFMSHVVMWHSLLLSNEQYLSIFEDDIYLGENADLFLNSDQWLCNHNLDFVKTETFLQERKLLAPKIALPDNREVAKLNEHHLGTAGYIISKNAAQSLLDFIQSLSADQLLPIDQLMFDQYLSQAHNLPVYQLNPALCAQEFILFPNQNNMPSHIESDRQAKKKSKPKRSFSEKLKGELSNAMRKTIGKLSRTKITFR
ncbi:glycosyltransferase family 25 protein [Moraxella pluranimalium]|uniref:Glycosyl transferase family 25 domain-containing protein n=1 Tax=Moraxella pluranimalium TaxID=470453 RepID=A0A1T0CDZ2_9GAMM|nr:glycosyltransferase family 25 protein [Moraxella pluranimalium]OOS20562.1 hypothetical protein B0680_10400 [Moraxella pluranimalium]